MWRSQLQRLVSLSTFQSAAVRQRQTVLGQAAAAAANGGASVVETYGLRPQHVTPDTGGWRPAAAAVQSRWQSSACLPPHGVQLRVGSAAATAHIPIAPLGAAPSRSSSSAASAPAKVLPFADGVAPEVPAQYRRTGKVQERFRVERQPAFAVVEVGGAQYKVTPDDLIYTERLKGVDVNDSLELTRVLLIGSRDATVVGRPFVVGARVTAVVEEQTLDAKVLIFKKRRRKSSRRLKGHRQPLTALRIIRVEGLEGLVEAA